jgi:hypothetical protein
LLYALDFNRRRGRLMLARQEVFSSRAQQVDVKHRVYLYSCRQL